MANWFSLPSRNAPLAETGWLRLAPCFVEDGWPLRWAGRRARSGPGSVFRRPGWASAVRSSQLRGCQASFRTRGGGPRRDQIREVVALVD